MLCSAVYRSLSDIYIPIWFYSNQAPRTPPDVSHIIYIPIWFYSNQTANTLIEMGITFTFQSGSIQINLRAGENFAGITFTFQSGSIQMETVRAMLKDLEYLHSNLVLFKSPLLCLLYHYKQIYIPIWFYSNIKEH